ncbi:MULTISPECIES: hypothetical protein [unclassified Moorena]|uniref:hypothetical protein n=1 Tax=unclassified Moorena TaxID=2683338 RepID=UPI0014003D00|nr:MULTISPECIES: hypothetical protein [unclassified Moorena]NEQ02810.1 hypothetical protein [Moorena sp. SIO3F7]
MLTMGIESKAWANKKVFNCDFGSTYYACGPMVLSDNTVVIKNRVHGRVKVIIIAKESSQVEVWKEDESYTRVDDGHILHRGEEKEYSITPEWHYATISAIEGSVVFAGICSEYEEQIGIEAYKDIMRQY